MAGQIFIGDELSAAGWRLAGMEVIVPVPGKAESVVRDVLTRADLLIMTALVAQELSPALLEKALTRSATLTHVVADIQGKQEPEDYAAKLRAQVGLGQ